MNMPKANDAPEEKFTIEEHVPLFYRQLLGVGPFGRELDITRDGPPTGSYFITPNVERIADKTLSLIESEERFNLLGVIAESGEIHSGPHLLDFT